jgi:hypothetical protein
MECLDQVFLFTTLVSRSLVKKLDWLDVLSPYCRSLSLDMAKSQVFWETQFYK